MTTFESAIKYSNRSVSELYSILIDFNELEKVIPTDKLTNWYANNDSCRFTVSGMGEVGLKIINAEPNQIVKYVGYGKVPFDFYLNIHLKTASNGQTQVQVKVEAKLNALLKMMASKQITKFVETLVDAIISY